jgi:hypothetical protein
MRKSLIVWSLAIFLIYGLACKAFENSYSHKTQNCGVKEICLVLNNKKSQKESRANRFCSRAPFDTTLKIILTAGQCVNDYNFQIIPARGFTEKHFHIEQQFVNTLVLWDEGPRHYLQGWKEYHSPWLKLDNPDNFIFSLISHTHKEATKFVPFEKTELYDAFKNSGGKRWANVLPLDYRPANVSHEPAYKGAFFNTPIVTTRIVKIRVSVLSHKKWKNCLNLEILNPEGHS